MKRKIFILSILLTLLLTIPVFAGLKSSAINSVEDDSKILPIGQQTTTVTSDAKSRGAVISTATISLSQGDPKGMEIFATTLCHVPVDKVHMRFYVDCLDSQTGSWSTVDSRDITFTKEETEGDLTAPMVKYSLTKQSKQYYRVRCVHIVTVNGESESLTSATDWLYIY